MQRDSAFPPAAASLAAAHQRAHQPGNGTGREPCNATAPLRQSLTAMAAGPYPSRALRTSGSAVSRSLATAVAEPIAVSSARPHSLCR